MLINESQTGEGKANYKGNKNDSNLSQHGGEGSGTPKGSDMGLLNPRKMKDYCGPGAYLKSER